MSGVACLDGRVMSRNIAQWVRRWPESIEGRVSIGFEVNMCLQHTFVYVNYALPASTVLQALLTTVFELTHLHLGYRPLESHDSFALIFAGIEVAFDQWRQWHFRGASGLVRALAQRRF